jgi:hypothetical protein
MRTLSLGRHRRARVWIDESAGAMTRHDDVARAVARAGVQQPACRLVTGEVMIPMGGMAGYGLLGIEISVEPTSDIVDVEVFSEEEGRSWETPLVRPPAEQAFIGLRGEFRHVVRDVFVDGARDRLAPCTVRLVEAVSGRVGSSPLLMSSLGRSLIEIALSADQSDDAIIRILDETLMHQNAQHDPRTA